MKRVAVAVCLTIFSAGASALAEPSEHEKALSTFEEGRTYIQAGNCDAAITKLTESVNHEPSIGARVSLADCYEKTDTLAAWRELRDAARLAFLVHDDRLAAVEARAAALEPRLPMVRLEGRGFEAPGFELRLDGDLVDPFLYRDRLIATSPGDHRLEALAPGRQWSSRVVAQAGSTRAVTVELEARSTVLPSVPAQPRMVDLPAAGGGALRSLAYVLGGVGLAGAGAGAAFGRALATDTPLLVLPVVSLAFCSTVCVERTTLESGS